MQTKATLMALVLLSGTIAGCTSDPDGGANDEIDTETLQNIQYFINGKSNQNGSMIEETLDTNGHWP